MGKGKARSRFATIRNAVRVVRMAHARFKADIDDVSECVDALFDDVVLANVPPETVLDADDFRRDRGLG